METKEKLIRFLSLLEKRDNLLSYYYEFLNERCFEELCEMFGEEEELIMKLWIPEVYNKKSEGLNGYDWIWEWLDTDYSNRSIVADMLIELESDEEPLLKENRKYLRLLDEGWSLEEEEKRRLEEAFTILEEKLEESRRREEEED